MTRPITATGATLGPIVPEVCYPLATFRRLSGLGDSAIRSARRAGLKVRYAHGRAFIIGDDWIDYLRAATDAEVRS